MRIFGIKYGVFLLYMLLGAVVHSQDLSTHQDWQARKDAQGSEEIFYLTSIPKKQEGSFKKRGQPYISVTSRPSKKIFNVVSVAAGYLYQEGCMVKAIVYSSDQKKIKEFELFTEEGNAWTQDEEADAALIRAMKVGVTLVIEGVSQKGTTSRDEYSLKGFSAAFKELEKLSGSK